MIPSFRTIISVINVDIPRMCDVTPSAFAAYVAQQIPPFTRLSGKLRTTSIAAIAEHYQGQKTSHAGICTEALMVSKSTCLLSPSQAISYEIRVITTRLQAHIPPASRSWSRFLLDQSSRRDCVSASNQTYSIQIAPFNTSNINISHTFSK